MMSRPTHYCRGRSALHTGQCACPAWLETERQMSESTHRQNMNHISAHIAVVFCAILVCISGCGLTRPGERLHLITLDPGHFHAALVQKSMYANVDPIVHVYAPDGDDLTEHLKRIDAYNRRTDQPTRWQEVVYK